ncbi:MAG: electron transfer flavoprotein subunit alpha [Bdellovibrionales bacterium RIFOXYD1_FULL_55_31]|nr:MAG: electron transfer flavoprotein subunit alpha [Bdellovibrionales bacterium RIFOXYD1_FULL_55_31]
MEKILYLAHVESDGTLSKAALESLGAAVELSKKLSGSSLSVGLIGSQAEKAAGSIASCGATSFFAVSGPEFDCSRYSTDAAAIEALGRQTQATLMVAAGTSRFGRAVPGATFRLNGRIDSRITGFTVENNSFQIQRWFYRQRMMSTQTRAQRPWALLLDPGVFSPWAGQPGTTSVQSIAVNLPELRTRVLGTETATTGPQTIRPDAKLLFVTGAGWTKKQSDGQPHVKEAEDLIINFLEKTRASLGSTKSLVDQTGDGQQVISLLSHINQVGQTGSTPRHQKGLSTCCHGEEPHTVGWRFINERRAINLDANCGWAQGKADVLYVADAFQVLKKVNELL